MTILNSFVDLNKSFNSVMPLAAIWLESPIKTQTGKQIRITDGDLIRVVKDKIVDVTQEAKATHKVLNCKGNISNTVLFFELQHLHTNDLLTLKIK